MFLAVCCQCELCARGNLRGALRFAVVFPKSALGPLPRSRKACVG